MGVYDMENLKNENYVKQIIDNYNILSKNNDNIINNDVYYEITLYLLYLETQQKYNNVKFFYQCDDDIYLICVYDDCGEITHYLYFDFDFICNDVENDFKNVYENDYNNIHDLIDNEFYFNDNKFYVMNLKGK